ncbi:MAG: hypothetical protein LUC99_03855 [Clostridiales bacterium]|nr:hypothetical protein [Clostridiales bacterium]
MNCQRNAILIPLERCLLSQQEFNGWLIGSAIFSLRCCGASSLPIGAERYFHVPTGAPNISPTPPVVLKRSSDFALFQTGTEWENEQQRSWASLRLAVIRPEAGARTSRRLTTEIVETFPRTPPEAVPEATQGAASEAVPEAVPQPAFTISRNELAQFLRLVPDSSPLHRGEDAILPGMLILNCLVEHLSGEIKDIFKINRRPETGTSIKKSQKDLCTGFDLDVRFHAPLRPDEPLRLNIRRNDQGWRGQLDVYRKEAAVRLRLTPVS